jgi:pilus assembly protein CpaC
MNLHRWNGRIGSLGLALALALGASSALAQKKDEKKPDDTKKDAKPLDALKPPKSDAEMVLAVGENKTIPASDVKNYSEGTPGIVDIKLTSDAKSFVVVGLKAGTTSILLIKNNGQEVNYVINVFARNPAIVEHEVTQLLEGFPSVKVRRVGARLFIDGTVSSEVDVKRIAQIASLYPGQVESLVSVGAKDRATNIRIDFFFVQFDKTNTWQLGVRWPTQIGGTAAQAVHNITYQFVPSPGATANQIVVAQPLPGLDIAQSYGWAKVLKQSTVITTNGSEAVFANGGEQNYLLATGFTQSIQKIEYGTNVTIQPFFDPNSRELDVKVNADVSDLVPAVSGTPIPGRQTSKLVTVVHMKLGQSLVLSGIHLKKETGTTDGIPLLSRIPILGLFFGSKGASSNETESLVFIVPSIVDAPSKTAQETIDELLNEYEDFGGLFPRFPHLQRTLLPPGKS